MQQQEAAVGWYLEVGCPVIDALELKASSTSTSWQGMDASARWDPNCSVKGVCIPVAQVSIPTASLLERRASQSCNRHAEPLTLHSGY